MSAPKTSREGQLDFETLNVRDAGTVLFVEISAPPMNLEGPELIRDLVSLIQQAEADKSVRVLVFKSADPEYFIAHVDVTRIKENREAAAKLNGDPSIGQVLRHVNPQPHIGKIYELTGPQSENMNFFAQEYSKALGRTITFQDIRLGRGGSGCCRAACRFTW